MIVPFNDLKRAAVAQAAKLEEITAEVIGSGWFVHGPHHAQFERDLAAYLGVPHILGVASGTDALELALRAVATPDRDVVVTVANAGGYTSCAAVAAGLRLRYCDLEPETLLISPAALEPLLDERVAAVVVTHLYGRIADVAAVKALCQPLGIAVIEDCAQCLGARNADGPAGSQGDLATFSFYPTKNLGALGDGGAIATSDPHLAAKIRSLRQYGWRTEKYRVEDPAGRNSRLDELQAAYLSFRLTLLDDGNRRRRDIISHYAAAASPLIRVLPVADEAHVGHLAVAVADDAEALRAHLEAAGIKTDVHYPVPDHEQAPWEHFRSGPLPVTESLRGRILSLPCFPELTDAEVQQVGAALSTYGATR